MSEVWYETRQSFRNNAVVVVVVDAAADSRAVDAVVDADVTFVSCIARIFGGVVEDQESRSHINAATGSATTGAAAAAPSRRPIGSGRGGAEKVGRFFISRIAGIVLFLLAGGADFLADALGLAQPVGEEEGVAGAAHRLPKRGAVETPTKETEVRMNAQTMRDRIHGRGVRGDRRRRRRPRRMMMMTRRRRRNVAVLNDFSAADRVARRRYWRDDGV